MPDGSDVSPEEAGVAVAENPQKSRWAFLERFRKSKPEQLPKESLQERYQRQQQIKEKLKAGPAKFIADELGFMRGLPQEDIDKELNSHGMYPEGYSPERYMEHEIEAAKLKSDKAARESGKVPYNSPSRENVEKIYKYAEGQLEKWRSVQKAFKNGFPEPLKKELQMNAGGALEHITDELPKILQLQSAKVELKGGKKDEAPLRADVIAFMDWVRNYAATNKLINELDQNKTQAAPVKS